LKNINNNQIIFSGLDDVEKLKSIYNITSVWIEEASECLEEDFRELNRRLRGYQGINKNGKILGLHKGYPFYTIGQRKGLDIALGKPAFVTEIIPETNTVVLGEEEELNRIEMKVSGLNWIKYDGVTEGMEAMTKIRYKDKGALSTLHAYEKGVKVRFYNDVKGVAPGQSAVFYEGDDVIGGGVIQRNDQPFAE
jgi:tRNA-specific 2-thiouridylase